MDTEAVKARPEANEHWLAPLGKLVAIAGLSAPLAVFFWRNIIGAIAWLRRHRPRITFGNRGLNVPETRLTFVLAEHLSFWHMRRAGDVPSMQLATEWFVTNASQVSVRILAARLARPRGPGTNQCIAGISDADDPLARAPDGVLISRGATVTLHLHYMMTPPPRHRPGKAIKVEVVVVDQYQREHRAPFVSVPNR